MPKPKGAKGGNPKPVQTEEFKQQQFNRADKEVGELSAKVTSIRLFVEDEAKLLRLYPNSRDRNAWLRATVHTALESET
ncbi:MAG: hypothetical protein KME13_11465 [Myxacorys californica WJT36-NPBG1]|nr:hypothetical protein [Myxacorys californica WJT36-NPBG1]